MERVFHTIGPIVSPDSEILILGTMPSPKSREAAFYYAHPQNRFWPALALVYGEKAPQTIAEKTALILRRRLALWDVPMLRHNRRKRREHQKTGRKRRSFAA